MAKYKINDRLVLDLIKNGKPWLKADISKLLPGDHNNAIKRLKDNGLIDNIDAHTVQITKAGIYCLKLVA